MGRRRHARLKETERVLIERGVTVERMREVAWFDWKIQRSARGDCRNRFDGFFTWRHRWPDFERAPQGGDKRISLRDQRAKSIWPGRQCGEQHGAGEHDAFVAD